MHVDDHRGARCADKLQVVPIAVWPAGSVSGPCRLWDATGLGWNRTALPSRVGRRGSRRLRSQQRHACFFQSAIALPVVALDTSRHYVYGRVITAARTWQDVIER